MILRLAGMASVLVAAVHADSNPALFRERVLPVLQKNCVGCHSATNASGGLDLSTLDSALAGGKHGSAVLPGTSKDSLLMQYVRGEMNPKMPLGGVLDPESITLLATAIDAMQPSTTGRKRDAHLDWLLRKPQPTTVPSVQDDKWARNGVDNFILAKLGSKNLHPAPPASKRALLRRVSFDLIGLPPTPRSSTVSKPILRPMPMKK